MAGGFVQLERFQMVEHSQPWSHDDMMSKSPMVLVDVMFAIRHFGEEKGEELDAWSVILGQLFKYYIRFLLILLNLTFFARYLVIVYNYCIGVWKMAWCVLFFPAWSPGQPVDVALL